MMRSRLGFAAVFWFALFLAGCSIDSPPSAPSIGTGSHLIRGIILDSEGNPAHGSKAILLEKNKTATREGIEPEYVQRDQSETDEEGSVGFADLPPGEYALLVSDDQDGAFGRIRIPEGPAACTLRVMPYGSISGVVPSEFLENHSPLIGRIDEIGHSVLFQGNGAFQFPGIPAGRYSLSLNITVGSVNYRRQPLEIEVESGKSTDLGDSLFKPWKVEIHPKYENPDIAATAAFGMVCSDSTIGRNRCSLLEEEDFEMGISILRFPIGLSVPVELTLFDSVGSRVGQGQNEWEIGADSSLAIIIR